MRPDLQAHQPADRRAALRRRRPVRPTAPASRRRHLARRARVRARGVADAQPGQHGAGRRSSPALHVLDAGVGDERAAMSRQRCGIRVCARARARRSSAATGASPTASKSTSAAAVVADGDRQVGEVAQRHRHGVQHRRRCPSGRRCARRSRTRWVEVQRRPVQRGHERDLEHRGEHHRLVGAQRRSRARSRGRRRAASRRSPIGRNVAAMRSLMPAGCRRDGDGRSRVARAARPPSRRLDEHGLAAAPRPRATISRSSPSRRATVPTTSSGRPASGRQTVPAGGDGRLLDERDGVRGQHEAGGEVGAGGGQHLARDEAERVAGGDDRVVGAGAASRGNRTSARSGAERREVQLSGLRVARGDERPERPRQARAGAQQRGVERARGRSATSIRRSTSARARARPPPGRSRSSGCCAPTRRRELGDRAGGQVGGDAEPQRARRRRCGSARRRSRAARRARPRHAPRRAATHRRA